MQIMLVEDPSWQGSAAAFEYSKLPKTAILEIV
jgi:hypothetical protein